MASNEIVFDSPVGNVKTHIRVYVESDGKKGHLYRGLPTLLLTTRGRKSGKLRRSALIYGRVGENYVVVASNAGASHHPYWYLNLLDNPVVELQVGADKFTASARTTADPEKALLWQKMVEIFPHFAKYQAKTGREIPVVILEPV